MAVLQAFPVALEVAQSDIVALIKKKSVKRSFYLVWSPAVNYLVLPNGIMQLSDII